MRRLSLVFAFVLSACSGQDHAALSGSGPFAIDDALAYFDAGTSGIVIVDPAGHAGPASNQMLFRVPAGLTPVTLVSAPRSDDPTRHQLLVADPGRSQVLVYPDKHSHPTSLSIGLPLDAIDVAGNGQWAIAYEPLGTTPTRSLFTFPNTVAVLNLATTPQTATSLPLGGAGVRPIRAVFADSMRLSALFDSVSVTRDMPFALVFAKGGLVPVDLSNAVAGQLLPLTTDTTTDVVPAKVLFTNNGGDNIRGTLDNIERAFVRSTAGQLYVIAISLVATAPNSVAVAASLENVVTPTVAVQDMALFFAPDGTELLLAAAGNELILVNGYTGVATSFTTTTAIDTLVPYAEPTTGAAKALAYDHLLPAGAFLRLDPVGLETLSAQSIQTVRLATSVATINFSPGSSHAVLNYNDGNDLGVLDLSPGGKVLDLTFANTISARNLTPAGDQLWVVSISPEDNQPYLAAVALGADLAVTQVRLDRSGSTIGNAGAYAWVDHGDASGAITFFPTTVPLNRSAAIDFSGVLYTNLLDQPNN